MIKINNGLNTFLDAAGKTLKTAPKLYDDLVQPTAKQLGKTLELIPRSINAALSPAWNWVIHREYNMAETEKLLSEKLKNVDPNKIVQPEAYVAVPALQAISYSMNNDELRNLYANLLSKSMNVDTKDSVHPSFVEIIKQMSPLEANLLKQFNDENKNSFPIGKIRLQISENNDEGVEWLLHIIDNKFGMKLSNYTQYSVSLENLQRLQLITIDYKTRFVNKSLYSEIENGDIVNHCKTSGPSLHKYYKYPKFVEGQFSITNLGREFISTCID